MSVSANSIPIVFDILSFMRSHAVLPSWSRRYPLISALAHSIARVSIFDSEPTLVLNLSPMVLFMVFCWYSTSLVALSVTPLLPVNVAGECSVLVHASPLLGQLVCHGLDRRLLV